MYCTFYLQIINKEDSNWWQAKLWGVAPTTPAGLIPSPELQEWRTSMSSREKARHEHAGTVHVPTFMYWSMQ